VLSVNSPLNQFNEDRPEFNGFNAFYFDKIYPTLLARESERKSKVKKAITAAIGCALAGFIIAFIVYTKTQSPKPMIFISIGGLMLGAGVSYAVLHKLKGETKLHLMGSICKFVGWEYSATADHPHDLTVWRENDLVPKFDREKYEDQMFGNAHGADFMLREAHLEVKKRGSKGETRWVTVFRGILMEIDFHRKFEGRTVVLRDAGWFNRKKKSGMKRVGLVDPKFEKAFEAYGTDQVEARYLLTPDFMQRLVDLETKFCGKKARFGFIGGKLYIGIEAPNQFEAGSMFKPLIDTSRTTKILGEIGAIFDVVDGVLKPQKATSIRPR
jgi:hypothetical protein